MKALTVAASCLFLVSLVASAGSSRTIEPHPFSVHDMVGMERVGAPTPSPDGKWIAFTVRSWDKDANKTTTNLWLVSSDGKTTRQLTKGKYEANTSPAWSPDSKTIAFISGRGGSQQVWAISAQGGDALQLTQLPVDVSNLRFSPSGSHLAFSAEVYPDAKDLEATATRDKTREEEPVKARKFDRLMIRHWDTWFEGKRNHLFVIAVKQGKGENANWATQGAPIDLMKGIDGDSPTQPFGGIEDYDWSPDGKEIAYTMQIGNDFAWSTDLNIYTVPVNGGVARNITATNKATDANPVYSPDGLNIAYLAMAKPGFEADRRRIKLYDRKTGKTRTLAEAWDASPDAIMWARDNKSLIVTAEGNARKKVFAVDLDTAKPRELVGDHYNSDVGLVEQGRISYTQDSFTSPAEIWTAALNGSSRLQLTHFNDERMKMAQISQPEEFRFAGAMNEKVQAWLFKPVGFREGQKYPVAFVIHGGPQSAIGDHFHYRWNPQALTGAGYAVIIVNFHGSPGFGQAFTDSISGDWGGKPFEDLMKGLDYALANYKWLDSNRVAALGASYGGWMINWINGHTNRFKCLVNHDGMFDAFSSYFTSDELWFPEWEFKGVPWEKPESFDKFSPARFVANWKTPTLVIHSAKDFRLVDTDGIATFTALQRRGIPSQLLYFPDENHWVMKSKNSIVWHETVLAWLDKWLKK